MRTQHEIQDPTIKGIFFLLFGLLFLVFAVVFAVIFIRQSESVMAIIMIECLFVFGIYGFTAMGIRNLKIAAHPELEEQEQEEDDNEEGKKGSRTVGIIFLFIALWSGVLTVWFLLMGLLRLHPLAAIFCMLFTALFAFLGTFMYKNKVSRIEVHFQLPSYGLEFKKKELVIYGNSRVALWVMCLIFIIVGLPITLFSLPLMTEAFIGGLLFLFLGGNFLFWGVRILIFSLRRGVKKIYIRPESISKPKPKSQPKSKSKKKSKPKITQTDSTLQGDSVHSIPYTAKPGKESVFNNQRVLEAEAEMERLKAKEEQRKQRTKAREERRQAQSEEYRQQVQARRERIANALAKKKSVFFIVAGLLLLVPFLVCLWCDFEIFEVLRSFSTTIFWYDDSIGRLFSHALRWLPALVVGCGLLVFGLYRKWMIKKKQAKSADNQTDKPAESAPEFVYVEGDSNLRTKIKNFKTHHPKLFVAACVVLGIIVCYIVLCVVLIIITTNL